MKKHNKLSEKERCLIEVGIKSRKSLREIGKWIDRPAKTVYAEIKRNGGKLRYYAIKAQCCAEKAQGHRKGYSKIEQNEELKSYIVERIPEGWSPDVIAVKWNEQKKEVTITRETIYEWVYNYKQDLIKHLGRKKKKRGGIKSRKSKEKIKDRVSVRTRADTINKRERAGDYEADLVLQQGNKSQNILTCVERKSRMASFKKNNSKNADGTLNLMLQIKQESIIPMKSMTMDNGLEFARHKQLGVDTYFCDPGAPYQKGAIEHLNGILRRHIDFKLDPHLITQEMLDSVAHKINSIPRKILGYLTPYQAAEKYKNMEKSL